MRIALALAVILTLLSSTAPAAEEGRPPEKSAPPGPILSFSFGGGAVLRPAADLEEGGDVAVTRLDLRPGIKAFISRDLQVAFGLGYSLDRYDFDGKRGLAAAEPWDDVETLRFTAFSRYRIDDRWTLFGAPSIRASAERGADLSDGFTWGVFAGASFKAGDTLTIGPGAGVFTDIEDRVTVFPFLLVDWTFADRWSLGTGRGYAASRGPGLALTWAFADEWKTSLGIRWERRRFRLDDDAIAPDGIGQEESLPISLALTHEFSRASSITLLAGMSLAGSLSLHDERGHRLTREDRDPAPFVGLTFSLEF
jgi:hypothetical protein